LQARLNGWDLSRFFRDVAAERQEIICGSLEQPENEINSFDRYYDGSLVARSTESVSRKYHVTSDSHLHNTLGDTLVPRINSYHIERSENT